MCKSTIDAEKLDYNTFIQLYQDNLYEKASGFSAEEISRQLDEIDKIYEKFKENQKSHKMLKSARLFESPSKSDFENALTEVDKAQKALGWVDE